MARRTGDNKNTGDNKHIGRKILLGILTALLIAVIAVGAIFGNTLLTLLSIEQISDAPAYKMTYYGGYSFDEYLSCGAGSERELTEFMTGSLAHGLGGMRSENHACSAFFAVTPDGDYIFARNYDTPTGVAAVLETDDTEGQRIMGVSNVGWLGISEDAGDISAHLNMLGAPYVIADAMNESGLAAAYLTARGSIVPSHPGKINLIDQTVIPMMLNSADTVEQAVESLSRYNVKFYPGYPSQYMLCDASGASAIVEYIDGEMIVLPIEGNYQVCTNFIIYGNEELEGYGSDRYSRIDAELNRLGGVIGETQALELLKENTISGMAEWSAVYNLTRRTLKVTFFGDYENVYEYSF